MPILIRSPENIIFLFIYQIWFIPEIFNTFNILRNKGYIFFYVKFTCSRFKKCKKLYSVNDKYKNRKTQVS